MRSCRHQAMSSDIYDGCGDTKGCFGSPNGCVELGNCDMMASYLGNASTLAWEIYGRNKFDLSNFYVAIGFSADKLMVRFASISRQKFLLLRFCGFMKVIRFFIKKRPVSVQFQG